MLLACLSDDFTGATDLETLNQCGPEHSDVHGTAVRAEEVRGLQAVVVASAARSWTTAEMERVRPLLGALRGLGARHVFYKVCSTFDSSPEIGSIGRMIDIGAEVFGQETVPVVAGAPELGRYCVFGNLFAAESIAEGAEVHRLDRHPTMSQHPVTPMPESDLRLHLAQQTERSIGLVDWRSMSPIRPIGPRSPIPGILLCDLLSPSQYVPLGEMLDHLTPSRPFFSVGSSGLAACLGAHWQSQGIIAARCPWPAVRDTGPVLVASGSCSPVTARQIACAVEAGFAEVPFSANAAAECTRHLVAGRSVILHTARGPNDARLSAGIRPGRETGPALGRVVREIISAHPPLRRVIFAGGDTSSHALAELNIRSLEMICPVTPGAPLCRAGTLEIICKGGQAGPDNYLLRAAGIAGSPDSSLSL